MKPEPRYCKVLVCVSIREREVIAEAARKVGLKPSTWIRMKLTESLPELATRPMLQPAPRST